ncbi:MAG: hypothetical protein HY898_06580 [Deltaproteobacteria bacterium]|nr:hypothetical protein [Deltaproteobacteria bacterium]
MRKALLLVPFLALACSSTDAGDLTAPVETQPEGATPDTATPDQASEPLPPQCDAGATPVEPTSVTPAPALIVTAKSLQASFEKYAVLHTLLGMPTEVVTVETICGSKCDDKDPTKDTAKAIKDFLSQRDGLKYVILGGDIEQVPSRKVHDSYKNPFMTSYTYDEDFFTDYYYSDLSEWDGNADGIYAQDAADTPDYRPEVPVSRIPATTAEEADRYLQKVVTYLTKYDLSKVGSCLVLSNVATQFAGMDIDGAFYFESTGRTLSLLPPDCQIRKMYATGTVDPKAELNSAASEMGAIEEGYNIIVHSGHGSVKNLTVEYTGGEEVTGQMVYGLKNSLLPIFLSSACEAGTFGANDSAGEMLMNAPEGGAIAYLGNTVIGLGLAGGMQLIDELLRYVQTTEKPMLGDAYRFAHDKMPEKDNFSLPIVPLPVPVVDQNSYQWTQKGVVLMGDLLIPVYKGHLEAAPSVQAKREVFCEGTRLTFEVAPAVDGPMRLAVGGKYYDLEIVAGKGTIDIKETADSIAVGLTSKGSLPAWVEIKF